MTIRPRVLRYTFSPNGTDDTIDEWSPNAGELYYIERVMMVSNGHGSYSNGSLGARLSIYPKNTPLNPSHIRYGYTPNSYGGNELYGNQPSGKEYLVGEYITEDEYLGIREYDYANDGCTITILIEMRQLL